MAKLKGIITIGIIALMIGCNNVEPGQIWRSELTGHRDLILRVDTCYKIANDVRLNPGYGLITTYKDSMAQCASYNTGRLKYSDAEGIKVHQLNTFFEYKTRIK